MGIYKEIIISVDYYYSNGHSIKEISTLLGITEQLVREALSCIRSEYKDSVNG
jgi:transposase